MSDDYEPSLIELKYDAALDRVFRLERDLHVAESARDAAVRRAEAANDLLHKSRRELKDYLRDLRFEQMHASVAHVAGLVNSIDFHLAAQPAPVCDEKACQWGDCNGTLASDGVCSCCGHRPL